MEHYDQASTKLFLKQVLHLDLGGLHPCPLFNGLHCTSFFGIVEVVAALVEMERYDIDERIFCVVHNLHGLLRMGMRKG